MLVLHPETFLVPLRELVAMVRHRFQTGVAQRGAAQAVPHTAAAGPVALLAELLAVDLVGTVQHIE